MKIEFAIAGIVAVIALVCLLFFVTRSKRRRMLVRFASGGEGVYNDIFDLHSEVVDVPLDRVRFNVLADLCRERPRHESRLTPANVAAIPSDLACVAISADVRKVIFMNIVRMCDNEVLSDSNNQLPELGSTVFLEMLRAKAGM